MRILALLIYLCCLSAGAATYYVDGTNSAASDSNPGTAISPWKTVAHAASVVSAGDNIIIEPATYKETVNVPNGSAGNPIVFQGVRANDGTWLTTIDPSTHYTNGWVAAPEIGSNVWKQTAVPFVPGEVHIGGRRSAFVFTMGDLAAMGDYKSVYTNATVLGLTSGSNYFTLPTNTVMWTGQLTPAVQVYSWDGMESLWGASTNSGAGTWTLYLRFRDGSSPNGLDVAVVRDGTATFVLGSYCTLSNLCLPNTEIGVSIYGHDGNTIASNLFTGGYCVVLAQGGSAATIVKNNIVNGNYYGYTNSGAWSSGSDQVSGIRSTVYAISKFLMGQSTSRYEGIYLYQSGNSNVVSGNVVTNVIGTAVELDGSNGGYSTNTVVANNLIANASSVGITSGPGFWDLLILSNTISDCNSQIRCHNLNCATPADSNRLAYIYRNISWLPNGIGDHIFTHSANYPNVTNLYSTYWIYNNSFSGGYGVINDNGYAKLNGGLPLFYYVNNILSSKYYVGPNSWGDYMWTNAFVIGAFDYNEVAPLTPNLITANPEGAWWGSHNVTNSVAQWNNVQGMSFQLPTGSPAIDAAIDTTASFTLGEPSGTNTYAALPQGGDTKVGSAWDMGALEHSTNSPPPAASGVLNVGTAVLWKQ